jgi:hypothetical protein
MKLADPGRTLRTRADIKATAIARRWAERICRCSRNLPVMMHLRIILMVVGYGLFVATALGQHAPVDVAKENPMKVYMHYMPWFETPQTLGGSNWGYHWKFNNRNPNVVDATGKRQIASHYYPKIGPYASRDPDVIEYHMLLMKYAGVDGVLIDWYGVQGTNGDIPQLLTSSNAIVDESDDFGLDFGVVLEDRFTRTHTDGPPSIPRAQANVEYLRDNYFNRTNYIRAGQDQDPLMLVFGPITFQTESQWTQILSVANQDVEFMTLWYESAEGGANADGEYAWIYEEENLDNHLAHQSNFYRFRAPNIGTEATAFYPGFNDYYQEGGVGNVVPFEIPHNAGGTLDALIDQYETFEETNPNVIDFVQLATFNDFGEGTMFEPTVETGYEYLKRIQEYTGVSYGEAELELIYRLYVARKEYGNNAAIDAQLEEVSQLLGALQVAEATELLNSVAPAGDYNGDGTVDGADYNTWRASYGTETVLHGTGADGNFDGVVDAVDYTVWRNTVTAEGAGGLASPLPFAVPEPGALALVATVAALGIPRVRRNLPGSCQNL